MPGVRVPSPALQTWTVIRFLHLAAMALFVGGQLALVLAVTPALRRYGTDEAMRDAARRFGVASAVSLVVLLATGAAMASHHDLWGDGVLQAKLAVLVLVFVRTALHVVVPRTRPLSWTITAASLVIVYLGVKLTYG